MNIQQALAKTINRQDLSTEEMVDVMRQIMGGEATPAQIGGFLVALRMKGESIDEITGAATVMRELASGVKVNDRNAVDTCGTGGDGSNLFNVSTASAFVVAAAGGKVAKHGNRSVSSKTGSADLLEVAGVNLMLNAEQVSRSINELGVGFMFAPSHHSAMKHAIGPRKELAQRTLFNMLGPLTNPAGVKNQVLGVFNAALCRPLAEVLQRLGSEHVLVVHSDDGLDEISLAAPTAIAELYKGKISEYKIKPEDVGVKSQSLIGLTVDSALKSYNLIVDALGKRETEYGQKAADMIALNAGAAIYAANITATFALGVALAQDVIASGQALEKFKEYIEFTQMAG